MGGQTRRRKQECGYLKLTVGYCTCDFEFQKADRPLGTNLVLVSVVTIGKVPPSRALAGIRLGSGRAPLGSLDVNFKDFMLVRRVLSINTLVTETSENTQNRDPKFMIHLKMAMAKA